MKIGIEKLKEILKKRKDTDCKDIKKYPDGGINLFDIYCKSDESR